MQPTIKLVEGSGLHEGFANPTAGPSGITRCLIVEAGKRLLLVDTGLGNFDYISRFRRLGPTFGLRLPRDHSRTLRSQLVKSGYQPDDVSDIVVTSLDARQSGGLFDFPGAAVHALPGLAAAAKNSLPRLLPDPARLVVAMEPRATCFGFACTDLEIGSVTVRLLQFSRSLPQVQGVALPHARGTVLHVGRVLHCVDELRNDGRLRDQFRAIARDTHPFSRLRVRQQLRSLYRSANDITFVASQGGTRSLSKSRGFQLSLLDETPQALSEEVSFADG